MCVAILDARPQVKRKVRYHHQNDVWKNISAVTSYPKIIGKYSESKNKIAMKSFQKFCHSELTLNYWSSRRLVVTKFVKIKESYCQLIPNSRIKMPKNNTVAALADQLIKNSKLILNSECTAGRWWHTSPNVQSSVGYRWYTPFDRAI